MTSALLRRQGSSSHAATDAEWCMIEKHNADPLLDISTRTEVTCISLPNESDDGANASCDVDGFDLILTSRPSFAQIAALKSAGPSADPSPIPSPIMRASTAGPALRHVASLDASSKYGAEYKLKKSGKKYIAIKC